MGNRRHHSKTDEGYGRFHKRCSVPNKLVEDAMGIKSEGIAPLMGSDGVRVAKETGSIKLELNEEELAVLRGERQHG